MELTDERDPNFVCMCGGNLVHIRTEGNGRRVFKCDKGNDTIHQELSECVICHLPKSIWADDGTICANCGLDFLSGNLKLTNEQKADIEKWKVTIRA